MIRVLHVLPRMPIGGVGSFLLNSLDYLSDDVSFEFLIIENVDNSTFLENVYMKKSTAAVLDIHLALINYSKILRELDRYLERHEGVYDAVHLHSANIGMCVFPLAKKHGINVRILHSHATKYSDSFWRGVRNFIIQMPVLSYATHLIACSELAGKFLFKKRKFTTIYNGIDISKFYYKGISKCSKFIIGHVGNFNLQKNHKYIIRIIEKLLEKRNDFELWLIGDGEFREDIEKLVNEKNMSPYVRFWGRRTDMCDLYNQMEVVILPSLYEGFPVALMEAQACGLSAVVSDTITREVDFFNDCIFLPIDSKAEQIWADTLANYKHTDKSRKAEAFRNSRFSLCETTKELEKTYKMFLAR